MAAPQQLSDADTASMGPRLFSRGNSNVDFRVFFHEYRLQWGHDFSAVEITDGIIVIEFRLHRFNGATTFQPWKLRLPEDKLLETSQSFNGATTFQPWK